MIWSAQLNADGLSQGDVVKDVVFTNAFPVEPVTKTNLRGGMSGWQPSNWKPDGQGICKIVVTARRGRALVLTHSCDIDKNQSKTRIFVAPVSPLTDLPPSSQQLILEQRRVAHFPLVGLPGGDSYADLRLATAIDPRMIGADDRVASMTEVGLEMLQARLMLLFTRRE